MNRRLTEADLQRIAKERNHTILSTEGYVNIHSVIRVECHTCGLIWQPTAHAYKNAKKTGCPECKKAICSKTHKNKVVSESTRRLIGEKASRRKGSLTDRVGELHPRYKGGSGRDFKNLSNLDYAWKTAVRQRCDFRCVITGKCYVRNLPENTKQFACHHLYSFDLYPDLRYDPKNGVYLDYKTHGLFHKLYGFGKNTEEQFADFCFRYYDLDWDLIKTQLNHHI